MAAITFAKAPAHPRPANCSHRSSIQPYRAGTSGGNFPATSRINWCSRCSGEPSNSRSARAKSSASSRFSSSTASSNHNGTPAAAVPSGKRLASRTPNTSGLTRRWYRPHTALAISAASCSSSRGSSTSRTPGRRSSVSEGVPGIVVAINRTFDGMSFGSHVRCRPRGVGSNSFSASIRSTTRRWADTCDKSRPKASSISSMPESSVSGSSAPTSSASSCTHRRSRGSTCVARTLMPAACDSSTASSPSKCRYRWAKSALLPEPDVPVTHAPQSCSVSSVVTSSPTRVSIRPEASGLLGRRRGASLPSARPINSSVMSTRPMKPRPRFSTNCSSAQRSSSCHVGSGRRTYSRVSRSITSHRSATTRSAHASRPVTAPPSHCAA